MPNKRPDSGAPQTSHSVWPPGDRKDVPRAQRFRQGGASVRAYLFEKWNVRGALIIFLQCNTLVPCGHGRGCRCSGESFATMQRAHGQQTAEIFAHGRSLSTSAYMQSRHGHGALVGAFFCDLPRGHTEELATGGPDSGLILGFRLGASYLQAYLRENWTVRGALTIFLQCNSLVPFRHGSRSVRLRRICCSHAESSRTTNGRDILTWALTVKIGIHAIKAWPWRCGRGTCP